MESKNNLFNLQIEQTILGTIIMNNQYFYAVCSLIDQDHFFFPDNQKIYEKITSSMLKGATTDTATLKEFFEKEIELGTNYLGIILNQASGIVSIKDYANEIVNLSKKRALATFARDLLEQVETTSDSADDIKQEAELQLLNIKSNQKNTMLQHISEPIKRLMDKAMEAKINNGLKVKIPKLDSITGGFQPGNLIIIASRPSMGKSALSVNMAVNAAKQDKAVVIFSLEMTADEVGARILSSEISVTTAKLKTGGISQGEYSAGQNTLSKLGDLPIFIDETPANTIAGIRSTLKSLSAKNEIGFVIVDYLQLLCARRVQNRVQEISEITQGLKALAKEFNIPILALSQLSRAVELRDNKRPQLSDLRESGSIEQDADIVMFLYREEYYIQRESVQSYDKNYGQWQENLKAVENLAELNILKNRNGALAKIDLYFDVKFGRFTELSG